MTVIPPDFVLEPDQFTDPVLWVDKTIYPVPPIDVSDAVMDHYLGEGRDKAIKSFGHDPVTGVHFLLTRWGTAVHTDKAYLRYTHQLILRNDGNRLRGLPRHDPEDQSKWHLPLVPGTLYCLDTHSPHQGLADPRFPQRAESRGMKAVLAVDRSVPLAPQEAYELLATYFDKQMRDFPFDPKAKFLKWKEPK